MTQSDMLPSPLPNVLNDSISLTYEESATLCSALAEGPPYRDTTLTLLKRYVDTIEFTRAELNHVQLGPCIQYVKDSIENVDLNIEDKQLNRLYDSLKTLADFLYSASKTRKEQTTEGLINDLKERNIPSLDDMENLLDEIVDKGSVTVNETDLKFVESIRESKLAEGLRWDEAPKDEQEARPLKKYQCVQLKSDYSDLRVGSVGIVNCVLESAMHLGHPMCDIEVINAADRETIIILTISEDRLEPCKNPPDWYPDPIDENGYLKCEGYRLLKQRQEAEKRGPERNLNIEDLKGPLGTTTFRSGNKTKGDSFVNNKKTNSLQRQLRTGFKPNGK